MDEPAGRGIACACCSSWPRIFRCGTRLLHRWRTCPGRCVAGPGSQRHPRMV